jgi:hypothetical protein
MDVLLQSVNKNKSCVPLILTVFFFCINYAEDSHLHHSGINIDSSLKLAYMKVG